MLSVSGSSQPSNTKQTRKSPLGSDMISKYLVQYVPETQKIVEQVNVWLGLEYLQVLKV